MMLAQRILDTLRANGPIATADLPKWFGDVERMDLDAEVNRLLRKSAISFTFNKYDLVLQKPVNGAHKPFVSQADAAPITRERFVCPGCTQLRFDAEFRHGALGKRFKTCKYCDQRKTLATRHQRNVAAPEAINGADHAPGQSMEVAREGASSPAEPKGPLCIPTNSAPASAKAVEPDSPANMAGGRAARTAEDSLRQTGESSGPDRLPPEKPTESGAPRREAGDRAGPLVSRHDLESLPSNTDTTEKRGNNRDVSAERCCDVASVPETSGSYSRFGPREDVRTPAGDSIAFPRNDSATGQVADSVLDRLAGKRAVLVLRRERLRVEYEAAQGAVEFEIQTIDGVVGQMMKLLGEGN